MCRYAKSWPDRVWAVEGANGVGLPQLNGCSRPGEHVVDVHEVRGTDPAVRYRLQPQDRRARRALDRSRRGRTPNVRVLRVDGELQAMRMLTDRREALTRRRVQTVGRLQALLAELLPGQAKRDITTGSGQGDAGQSPSS